MGTEDSMRAACAPGMKATLTQRAADGEVRVAQERSPQQCRPRVSRAGPHIARGPRGARLGAAAGCLCMSVRQGAEQLSQPAPSTTGGRQREKPVLCGGSRWVVWGRSPPFQSRTGVYTGTSQWVPPSQWRTQQSSNPGSSPQGRAGLSPQRPPLQQSRQVDEMGGGERVVWSLQG